MSLLSRDTLERGLNVGLRLASMVTKLGLTLYMGRYLSLADMGVYGLVFSAVMILASTLGLRFDYVVLRDIVGAAPRVVTQRMRDQALFYGLNHLALAALMLGAAATGWFPLSPAIWLFIFLLSVMEALGSATYANLNSLGRPLLANAIFFVRSGLWTIPVTLLGLLDPAFRTVEAILCGWVGGSVLSLLATAWVWRGLPWSEVRRAPMDWSWIRGGLARTVFIWLGTLGMAGGVYADRFIVSHYLGLDAAGIATFYFSFVYALLPLLQSGVLAYAYPRLIALHKEGNADGFRQEARKAVRQTAIFSAVMVLGTGIAVPVLAHFLGRPQLVEESLTLWLMLLGLWIRAVAEALHYILFAWHRDRPIWMGNLLFMLPALACNAVLVPLVGLSGVGYGTILASLFLLIWRLWHVRRGPDSAPISASPKKG